MAQGTATKLALEGQAPAPSALANLVLSARLEFDASLVLLAERARFITGASWTAIALRDGEQVTYRAAAGPDSPEIGAEAAVELEAFSNQRGMIGPDGKSLLAPIVRDFQVEGFFQAVSKGSVFTDHDLESVVRLAEMVGTALDHMDAAEHSGEVISSPDREPVQTVVPLRWHAPEGVLSPQSTPRNQHSSPAALPANVRTCESCGFPVSPGRNICVECDEHGKLGSSMALFTSEKPSSWLRTHGYTIASLLVPAAAAVIIYWLR